MSYLDFDRPIYYPEEYDYSLYYQNEFPDYSEPKVTVSIPDPHSIQSKKNMVLPNINYLNERKCPIYIHHLKNDFSVYNNYNQKMATPRKKIEIPKVTPQNASKLVLDKLEETYWATWKPKKENLPVKKKSPRKILDLGFSDARPQFRVHNKASKKTSNKPHGDISENILKYFKTKNFASSSTAASVTQEDTDPKKTRTSTLSSMVEEENGTKPDKNHTTISIINESIGDKKSYKRPTRPRKFEKTTQKDLISQEIQTEAHCPVILEQMKNTVENLQVIFEREEETHVEYLGIVEKNNANINQENEQDNKVYKQEETKNKQGENIILDEKSKNHSKYNKKPKKSNKKDLQEVLNLTGMEDPETPNKFVKLKDSLEIARQKQEKLALKEHYQQPKCIRLYRKSGGSSGYMKGGTYPLKSCLKDNSFSKGNFRLGAPGSPMFITTSPFSSKIKK